MPFEFIKQEIEDVILVKPKVFGDNRGFFMESYKKSDFFENGINVKFNQDNHSKSTAHVLRGLHYQAKPYGQQILHIGSLSSSNPKLKPICKSDAKIYRKAITSLKDRYFLLKNIEIAIN